LPTDRPFDGPDDRHATVKNFTFYTLNQLKI